MKFTPYYDKVRIEPVQQDGVLTSLEERFIEMGIVQETGRDVKFLKKGDLVYFNSYGISKTPDQDGKRYYVIPEHSDFILGKATPERQRNVGKK